MVVKISAQFGVRVLRHCLIRISGSAVLVDIRFQLTLNLCDLTYNGAGVWCPRQLL